MALQALKKRESFSDKAYQMLREAILTGELKPGEQLTEEALSAQLGISRTQSIEHFPFALFFTFSMALSCDKRDVFFACLQVFLQILQLVQSGGFFHPLLYCLQLLFPFQKPHKVYSIPARFFRLPAGIDPTLISVHHYLEQHSWIDFRFPSFRRIGPIHKSVLCRRK